MLSLSNLFHTICLYFFKAKTFDADAKQKMHQGQVSESKVGHILFANYQRYTISDREQRPTKEL